MTLLFASDVDFDQQLSTRLAARQAGDGALRATVVAIIDRVRGGDHALHALTQELDGHSVLRLSVAMRDRIAGQAAPKTVRALEVAIERITRYHKTTLPPGRTLVDEGHLRWGAQWTPVDAAGVYVPGGLAAYPSSLLMGVIPAQVAGVERIAITMPVVIGKSPAPMNNTTEADIAPAISPAVMAAAQRLDVTEIHTIGGAQAIAALAYGTETITPVDMITGPGNAYVAHAKREVFGHVGIDSIAGPSEVLVIADGSCSPQWVAYDLLAQSEHDKLAQAILITPDRAYADAVGAAVTDILATLPRREIAAYSWAQHGMRIVCTDLPEAFALANRIAPEHLALCVDSPDDWLDHIKHAGAVFLGATTPEALGDYLAGPNHVLPTSGAARFASGLSCLDYMKRTTLLSCPPAGFDALADACAELADAEGLHAHAGSVRVRKK